MTLELSQAIGQLADAIADFDTTAMADPRDCEAATDDLANAARQAVQQWKRTQPMNVSQPMFDTLKEAEDLAYQFGKPGLADRLYALGCHLGSGAPERYYTITKDDVGKAAIHAFGQRWPVAGFLGRVLPLDIGKRVHKVGGGPGRGAAILQVESNEQRDRRVARDG